MAAHLELAERDARARGLSADAARRDARLRFGGVEAIREMHRDARGSRLFEAAWRDVRHARRRLARRPIFFAAAIATLALGIGINALAFSAVSSLLFGPLAVADADRVVWIHANDRVRGLAGEGLWSYDVEALAAAPEVFESVAVIGARARVLATGNRRAEWRGLWTTTSLAHVLRVTPAAGRLFTDADVDSLAAAPAMMIGYERWIAEFAGDPAIVGRTLRFEDNKPHTVIGVLPRGFAFPEGRSPGAGSGIEFANGVQDFWVLGQQSVRDYPGGMTLARLREGVTIAGASDAVARIAASVASAHAELADRSLSLTSLRDHALGPMRRGLPVILAGAILVLMIASANLGCLMLARSAAARPELTLRTALGATRGDLRRLVAAECLWIAGGGAALGLALTWLGRHWLARVAAGRLVLVDRISIDPLVIGLAVGTAVAATLACGLLTAQPRRLARSLDALIVAQVGIALVLLVGAAMLVGSVTRLLAVDTGYERRHVVAADVLLFEPPKEFVPFFVNLHARLKSLPGIASAGLIQSTPLTGKWSLRERVTRPAQPAEAAVELELPGSFVAFEYFDAMSIPIVAGRTFTLEEVTTPSSRVIVVNDLAAQRFFPNQPAVGKYLWMLGKPHEIVGVVKATRDVRLEVPAEPQWYQPAFVGGSQVIVRGTGDSALLVDTLRRELAAADSRLVIRRVEPLDAIVEASVFERRLATQVLTVFALLALVLALIGLFGVVSFQTTERRREFGIRIALGSSRSALAALVLTRTAILTAIGIVIGAVGAVPLTNALESLLFGIRPGDVATIAVMALALGVTALAACAWPAWRASAADPLTVLKRP